MKALVAQKLSGPSGLAYTDVDEVVGNDDAVHARRLARRGALRPGETVLVLGSAGGVGTAAIQIAKALGAKVIAMVHRPQAIEFVESSGADVVLPLTDGWLQTVKEHTDGRGVDLVVDPIGGETFDEAVRALAVEGRLLVKAGLRPPPPMRCPLSKGAEALQILADGGVLGMLVLEP